MASNDQTWNACLQILPQRPLSQPMSRCSTASIALNKPVGKPGEVSDYVCEACPQTAACQAHVDGISALPMTSFRQRAQADLPLEMIAVYNPQLLGMDSEFYDRGS